ncbi:MAG: SRPBCC domain-containing protein [Chitinophagales bacterium]|nr:SRPBCC domain-containing protein [Chitinophagales bacterium]
MERKTQVHAEEDRQELTITREFDLPAELVFKAYTDPDILEQWMGCKIIKQESRKHGAYEFQTYDPKGNLVFTANGVFHELVPGKKITRTFEMDNVPFDAQLEFLNFEPLSDTTSKLTIKVVYKSPAIRDQVLALPFAFGINMAHNRLQQIVGQLK